MHKITKNIFFKNNQKLEKGLMVNPCFLVWSKYAQDEQFLVLKTVHGGTLGYNVLRKPLQSLKNCLKTAKNVSKIHSPK